MKINEKTYIHTSQCMTLYYNSTGEVKGDQKSSS